MLRRSLLLAVACLTILFAPSLSAETITGSFLRSFTPVTDSLTFEIANTQAQRSLGLMYRRELAPDSGMLFVYPTEEPRSFWMKNTYIPLDIIFLDKHLRVQGVVENAPPRTTLPQSVSGIASMYVVELKGGRYKSLGITVGDILSLDKEPPTGEFGS